MGGISLLVVERTEGLTTKKMDCMGVLSSGTSYVEFDEVKVPVENLLGKENKGFQLIMSYAFPFPSLVSRLQLTSEGYVATSLENEQVLPFKRIDSQEFVSRNRSSTPRNAKRSDNSSSIIQSFVPRLQRCQSVSKVVIVG